MADSSNSRENCLPIYHTSPLTLQQLASMRVALCIWLKHFRQGCPASNEFTFKIQHLRDKISKPNKFTKNLPSEYKKMINFCIDPINNEIKSWYDSQRRFLKLDDIHNCNRFDLVVFGGDGKVHVQDTTANFLDDDFFTNEQKFQIACRRCMEEKVDFFWPLVSENFQEQCTKPSSDPLLYYWTCRKRGELNRIPLEDFDRIEHLMIAKCCDTSYFYAVRYFLGLLDPHDRIYQINQMLQYSTGFHCVESLLPHLEAHIQHYVFGKRLKSLSKRFIKRNESIEYTVQTWLYIRDSFTPERFYKDIVHKFATAHYTCGIKLFSEIWSNTPFHLKEYTLKNHLSNVLNQLFTKYFFDFGIILAILSDADVSSRDAYWKENWAKWVEIISFSEFKELLASCVIKPEVILDFENFPEGTKLLQTYCLKLMEQEHFTVLDEILNNLHLTEEQVFQLKKQILASRSILHFSESSMEKHSKYIDRVFSGHEELSQDFKDSWILSDRVWNQIDLSVRDGRFNTAQSVISFFSSSKCQAECKSKLLEVYRNQVINGRISRYDSYEFKGFLLWCVDGDEKRVDDFWASLPIDDFFEAKLTNDMRSISALHFQLSCGPRFDRRGSELNQFLKWYFKSKLEFENFKREKIEYYERMDETAVNNKFGRNKRLVIAVLREGFLMVDDDSCIE